MNTSDPITPQYIPPSALDKWRALSDADLNREFARAFWNHPLDEGNNTYWHDDDTTPEDENHEWKPLPDFCNDWLTVKKFLRDSDVVAPVPPKQDTRTVCRNAMIALLMSRTPTQSTPPTSTPDTEWAGTFDTLRKSLVECVAYLDRMGQDGVRERAYKALALPMPLIPDASAARTEADLWQRKYEKARLAQLEAALPGVVEALEKFDDESAIITPPGQDDFVDAQLSPEAYEGLYAALSTLKSLLPTTPPTEGKK